MIAPLFAGPVSIAGPTMPPPFVRPVERAAHRPLGEKAIRSYRGPVEVGGGAFASTAEVRVSVVHAHRTVEVQLPLESGSFLLELDLGDAVPPGYWAKLDGHLGTRPTLPCEPGDPDPDPVI